MTSNVKISDKPKIIWKVAVLWL